MKTGARHISHIEDIIGADISLTQADLEEIEKFVVDATPVAGPSPEGMP